MSTGHLNLAASWGPFSPVYFGLSRILDPDQGTLAELALHVERRRPATRVLPDTIFGYSQNNATGERHARVQVQPEGFAADYRDFGFRYWLDAQGGDSALARFAIESDARARCELTFENTGAEEREYAFGLGLLVSDPRKPIRLKPGLEAGWLPARNYTRIESYQKTFGMGCRTCITRAFNWGLEDEVLAQAFGGWEGDRVFYRHRLPAALRDGFLYFRYVKYGTIDHPWELRVNGRAIRFRLPQTFALPGNQWGKNRDGWAEWRLLRLPLGDVPAGDLELELYPVDPPGNDRARIWLDGMLLHEGRLDGDDGAVEQLPTTLVDQFDEQTARVTADAGVAACARLRIRVPGAPDLRVAIASPDARLGPPEEGRGSYLASLRPRSATPEAALERDATALPWVALRSEALTVPARSRRTVAFVLELAPEPAEAGQRATPAGRAAAPAPDAPPPPPQGPHADLVAGLRDALLFNVNYPFVFNGRPTPYIVPAKFFSIPYSWDGGFAAAGLATFAPGLAREQTAFFLAGEKDDFPFFYCGSPVPTPLYALWDLYQTTQDEKFLARTFAGAKRMHDFYLGRTPGSQVHPGGDGLLSTYAYCYNLGIDDHPIQRWAEECHLTRRGLYSIILLPQILRTARILRNMAHLLGRAAEAEALSGDVRLLSETIDGRMWDDESGLYGWLARTESGAVEPVRLDGCAGDRSACAFLPLFGGLTSRKDRLLRSLLDPARFWTPYGVSSVDRLAPSYNPNGYWNGAVWPVMQWYLWQGLLEAGEPDLARQVVEKILATWQGGFRSDHYLGEHFVLKDARMRGAPNFGGLSAVLLPMHAAYYTPYQVTLPCDAWLRHRAVDAARDTLTARLEAPFLAAAECLVLANMGRGGARYALGLDGRPGGEVRSDAGGHLTLRLPRPGPGGLEFSLRPAPA